MTVKKKKNNTERKERKKKTYRIKILDADGGTVDIGERMRCVRMRIG